MKIYIDVCSKNFVVFVLVFRSLVHFELFSYLVLVGVQLHSFTCGYPGVPAPFIEKGIVSLWSYLGALVGNLHGGLFLDS